MSVSRKVLAFSLFAIVGCSAKSGSQAIVHPGMDKAAGFSLAASRPQVARLNVAQAPYNANGHDALSDRVAIQRAIDDAAALGAGTEVFFPEGTYLLDIVGTDGESGAYHWPKALALKPGVVLKGAGAGISVLKLMANQPRYGAIMAPGPLELPVDGFKMFDLTLDANSVQNPIASLDEFQFGGEYADQRYRNGVYIEYGAGVEFRNNEFKNFASVWVLKLGDYLDLAEHITVSNNEFKNIGFKDATQLDFDSSTVYVNSNFATVENNRFESSNGVGTWGLRTAIESHGMNNSVQHNEIKGFPAGINVGGDQKSGNRFQMVAHNEIKDAYLGVYLFPELGNAYGEPFNPGMTDITIKDNDITLNVAGWQNIPNFADGVANGISFFQFCEAPEYDAAVENLSIVENKIKYVNFAGASRGNDFLSFGIWLGRSWCSNEEATLINTKIIGNKIINPMSAAIELDQTAQVQGLKIEDNTIVNSGASPAVFDYDVYRSGIILGGPIADVSVSFNKFIDKRSPFLMPAALYSEVIITGFANAQGNKVPEGIPLLNVGGGSGEWNTEPLAHKVRHAHKLELHKHKKH